MVTGWPNQGKIQLPRCPTVPNTPRPSPAEGIHSEWHRKIHPGIRGPSCLSLAGQGLPQ